MPIRPLTHIGMQSSGGLQWTVMKLQAQHTTVENA
jgi:hypothetical protein